MRWFATTALFLGLAVGVSAQNAKTYTGEITATQLRLRAGPGQAYQEVVRLSKGDRVIVLGKHANSPAWLEVEVPQGYTAWVFAEFIEKRADGTGKVITDRLQIRPRPSTRYHQLSGRLNTTDAVRVVEQKRQADGLWYRVTIPRRIPLYAHGDYVKNIGAASLADQKITKGGTAKGSKRKLDTLALRIDAALKDPKRVDTAPMAKTLKEIKPGELATEDRVRYYRTQAQLAQLEKTQVIRNLRTRESELKDGLDKRLAEIDREYRRKLEQIEAEARKPKRPRYTAIGIVRHAPDILGKYPSHRLVEGGKLRYYLISSTYDLTKFSGKRVGVIGLADPESGTGRYTIMVRRIEIIGDK
ncbi:MAG: SH3 domain-containing protein [Planctomycetota bacterium]|nr:SH3 domain-containing protein [Planctomycetota bacterium]